MAEGCHRNFGSRRRFLSRSRSIRAGGSGSFSNGLKVGAGGGGGGCHRNFGKVQVPESEQEYRSGGSGSFSKG